MKERVAMVVLVAFVVAVAFFLQPKREPFQSIPIYRPKPAGPCCGKGSFCPVAVWYPFDPVTGQLI